jgi:ribosomal protein L11 methylase PrmA
VEKLVLKNVQTEWGAYYAHTNYSDPAADHKKELVGTFFQEIQPATVWDLGANDGTYSRLALEQNAHVAAFDIDPVAVERNYSFVKREKLHMLPLVLDLTNPSPGIGFANRERGAIDKRNKPDCIMALALIHHLVISNNLPLNKLATWLAELCDHLIIEFIPKEDSQVRILLSTRTDIFPGYTQDNFEAAFNLHFILRRSANIDGSYRKLYWYERKKT